jgi:hypothetical protein
MRFHGENLNAYHAMSNTMERAVWLGSVRVAAAVADPERQQAFVDTVRDIVSDILKEGVGVRLAWPNPPYPARGHERADNP